MMAQFGAILTLRRRLAKNRLAALSPGRRTSTLLLVLGGMAALLVGGHLAAPTLMVPPVDLATGRGLGADGLPAGASALEAAFWLSALLASVLNFRVLELLFRRPDIVALQVLPVEPAALFLDRAIATFIEAAVAAAATSIFFVPLIWHGGATAALASSAMLFGGLIFGATISLCLMLMATQRMVPDTTTSARNSTSLADAYGGSGQLLLYAPALALGGVVILALFWKLLLGEPLRLGYFSPPFWIGSAIVLAIAVGCLVAAYRVFVEYYYAMAPRFHEADAAEFDALLDYQISSFDEAGRWEMGLPHSTARTYRALVLDDDRRVAGGRVGYVVVILLAVIALATFDLDVLPGWAAAMIPATLTAAIVNPWRRLTARAGLLDTPLGLPISASDRSIAVARVSIREFLFIGLPYAVAAAVILGYFRGMGFDAYLIAALALVSGFGIAGGVSMIRHLGAGIGTLRWLPAALLVALAACAIYSLIAAIAASLVVAITAAVISRVISARTTHG